MLSESIVANTAATPAAVTIFNFDIMASITVSNDIGFKPPEQIPKLCHMGLIQVGVLVALETGDFVAEPVLFSVAGR